MSKDKKYKVASHRGVDAFIEKVEMEDTEDIALLILLRKSGSITLYGASTFSDEQKAWFDRRWVDIKRMLDSDDTRTH